LHNLRQALPQGRQQPLYALIRAGRIAGTSDLRGVIHFFKPVQN
jgi:hypothetical protein